jgi:F-type H+-transporting ATPase subunit b
MKGIRMARRTVGQLAGMALAGAVLGVAATPAQADGGMPQLDFGNPLTQAQVVWLALIFLALYLLLSRWALPQVGAVLEKRAGVIAADLDAARAAKEQADAAVAELTKATRDAHAGAQAEIAEALAGVKAKADAAAAELNAKLDAQIAASERQIEAARRVALGALEQVAAETAGVVVARLIGTPIDHEAVPRAVAAVLAERAKL